MDNETLSMLMVYTDKHPFLSILWAWCACWIVALPFRFALRALNRFFRSRNIKHHGWPPPHLDADGDFILKESP